jgi:hypothetical protein
MRPLDPNDAHRFLDAHMKAGNKVDDPLMEAIRSPCKLFLLRLEDAETVLSLIWYQALAVRVLAPPGTPRTLRDVAQRVIQRGYTFDALSTGRTPPPDEHDPDIFRPCIPIDGSFDFCKFGWVAVVAPTGEERHESPRGSYYIFDGLHKSLVLAKRLLAGQTNFQTIEALYITPRP